MKLFSYRIVKMEDVSLELLAAICGESLPESEGREIPSPERDRICHDVIIWGFGSCCSWSLIYS